MTAIIGWSPRLNFFEFIDVEYVLFEVEACGCDEKEKD
jgi:hypothetical protein